MPAPKRAKKAGAEQEEASQPNFLEESFGVGFPDMRYQGSEDVPLSGERIAVPEVLYPRGSLTEFVPPRFSELVGDKILGVKALQPVLLYGSEFGVAVIFLVVFLQSWQQTRPQDEWTRLPLPKPYP